MKKTINIPSITTEKCNLTLNFENKNLPGQLPWKIEVKCETPNFTGHYDGEIEYIHLVWFLEELKEVEKDRKGKCSFYDEWGFALNIRSIDSVGHFVIDVNIWVIESVTKNSRELGKNNKLDVTFEIEPSLLTSLVKDFETLV